MTDKSDWRLQGQEKYLKGATLVFKNYKQYKENPEWDHDHCEFCQAKFSLQTADKLRAGYCTTDEKHWICPQCYEDFKDSFYWKLENK